MNNKKCYNIFGEYMKIRLGYACLNRSLKTSYKNYTYTKFKKEFNFDLLDNKTKNSFFFSQKP